MKHILLVLVAACATERAPAVPIDKPPQETGAVVLVIDRSGSMQGAKLEAVKEAAAATVESLDANESIAIVTYDSEAQVPVPLQSSAHRAEITSDIAKLQAGGGTNIFPGLKAAAEILVTNKAQHRHIILLSDGEAPTDGLVELVREMKAKSITLSTVAVEGADEKFLEMLSAEGGGHAYNITDLAMLKQTFVHDTRIALQ